MVNRTHVVVVGGGNAALCAALSAAEQGSRVTVVECADRATSGGNTAFTAGAMRVAYDGVDDLLRLMPELSEEELRITDFGTYTRSQFLDDLARVTEHRTDPDLAGVLVDESLPTLEWMHGHGVRFVPIYGRQAFKVDGRFKFWGGLTVEVSGGGKGLVASLTRAAERAGVSIAYETRAVRLAQERGRVAGVEVVRNGVEELISSDAVVLASGGFQANAEWRTRYLGPGWDLAKVRGTFWNTGDGHRMALALGASPAGNWSGCHAVSWDRNAPEFGDLEIGDHFQKHSYPWGVMVNARGERFVDEGADFRNFTYAKYGRVVLGQPGQVAWQVFDRQTSHLLRDEYRIKQVTKVTAGTLEELAARMDGVDSKAFLETIRTFNDAVDVQTEFDPNIRDGKAATGLAVPKSNWATTISEPPFEAYQVTCGITFTFGGLRIRPDGAVLSNALRPIPGLYAAGEIVGGLFYFNYPGGSGLTSGAVFGRIAGRSAATPKCLSDTP